MKIRDKIIQYIKILEYTVDLFRQKNEYQNHLNNIPFGSSSREIYLHSIRELDEIIGAYLLQLQKLKKDQPL